MSGGFFTDYPYHKVEQFIEEFCDYLHENSTQSTLSTDVAEILILHGPVFEYVRDVMQAIDYLASNDYSEEVFKNTVSECRNNLIEKMSELLSEFSKSEDTEEKND